MKTLASFLRNVGLWLGPSTRSYDLVRICALSAIVGFFYLYFGAFGIENGFANYTDWADTIVSGASLKGRPEFYIRDVGMPLILLISGYPFTHSLIAVIVIQFVMGLVMPALVYLALRPWLPRTAYFAGIASVLSLAPFMLAKTMHHDQPYIFFMILSLYITNRYIETGRPAHLYRLAFSVFFLSLIRQTGKALYPGLVLLTQMFGRTRYKHVAASVIIFVVCNLAYGKYREIALGELPVVGREIFENVYFNSSEYGVKLSPEFGPNVKYILDRIYQCMLPSPAKAKRLTGELAPSNPVFMAENFYKYTTDELYQRMLTHTNFTNLLFVEGCLADGVDAVFANHVYLMAWLETARAHPLFILEYALRNSWELLYDPGWLHGQNTTEPHMRGGLLFQLGGVTTAGRGNIGDRLPEPALSEAKFIPLARQPQFIQSVYVAVESAWSNYYHPITEILFYFTCICWISTAIGLVSALFKSERLDRWCDLWLSKQVVPATAAASFLLLANVAVTGLFVDSYYRYDFSLTLLKIMLGTVGCAIVLNLIHVTTLMSKRRLGNQMMAAHFNALGSYFSARGKHFNAQGSLAKGSVLSPVALSSVAFIAACVLVVAGYAHFERSPGTQVRELPKLSGEQQWDFISGLNADVLAGPQVVDGQTVLRLTAVPSEGRHALALHFHNLVAGAIYRVMVWVKTAGQTSIQLQVRDSVIPLTGKANEGEARFNLTTGASLTAQGNVLARGVEQAADDWRKVWVDLRTADGEVFVTLGMLEVDSNSHVFKGNGQQLTLGGISVSRQVVPPQIEQPSAETIVR